MYDFICRGQRRMKIENQPKCCSTTTCQTTDRGWLNNREKEIPQ
jgi:hypothetical protein